MREWKYKSEDNDEAPDLGGLEKIFSIEKNAAETVPVGNKIYFYSDITKDTVLTLIRQMDEIAKQLKIAQYTYNFPNPPAMEIHICSDGGDVFPSIGLVDKIISSEVPVYTYCEGVVASAATLISVAGHKRFITKNSCMLIHQVSSGLWGNYAEFKDEVKNLDLIMHLIKNVYVRKSKITAKQLNDLLSHDLYMSAEECLDRGLVDVIL